MDLAPDTPLPDGEPYVTHGLSHTDTAALFYTLGHHRSPQGRSDNARGISDQHRECDAGCLGLPRDLGEELRTLISVPLFHVTGCNSQLLAAARLGGASVIMPALSLDQLIATLTAERISLMVTVPAIYSLLLRHKDFAAADVSAVRWVGYGGAPIAPSLVQSSQELVSAGHGVQRVRHDRDGLLDDRAS